jgi:hypothetical protein
MEHNFDMADINDHRTIEERFCDIAASTNAIRLGVRRALWRHKQLGQSVAVWEDGRVVILKPEEIPIDSPD